MTTWVVLVFWAGSMAWFARTHLGTTAENQPPPPQQELLPTEPRRLEPIRWRLSLDGRPVGWAEHRVQRREDGFGEIASTVRIERLSVEQLAQQGLGGLGAMLLRGVGQGGTDLADPLSMTVESVLRFDEFGQFHGFNCQVLEDDWGECIHLQGVVVDETLRLKAYLLIGDLVGEGQEGRERGKPVFETRLPMPPDGTLTDAFMPSPQMRGLAVGDHWTWDSYLAFFPMSPLKTMEAEVVEEESIEVDGRSTKAFRVEYRRGPEDALSLDRRLGNAWVLADGTVVRQTLVWGQFEIEFARQDAPREVP